MAPILAVSFLYTTKIYVLTCKFSTKRSAARDCKDNYIESAKTSSSGKAEITGSRCNTKGAYSAIKWWLTS